MMNTANQDFPMSMRLLGLNFLWHKLTQFFDDALYAVQIYLWPIVAIDPYYENFKSKLFENHSFLDEIALQWYEKSRWDRLLNFFMVCVSITLMTSLTGWLIAGLIVHGLYLLSTYYLYDLGFRLNLWAKNRFDNEARLETLIENYQQGLHLMHESLNQIKDDSLEVSTAKKRIVEGSFKWQEVSVTVFDCVEKVKDRLHQTLSLHEMTLSHPILNEPLVFNDEEMLMNFQDDEVEELIERSQQLRSKNFGIFKQSPDIKLMIEEVKQFSLTPSGCPI